MVPKVLQILFYPFSLIYGTIMAVRNTLFDLGVLPSTSYDIPIIAVGNLRVGGTGKTPMVEYLIRSLGGAYKIAVVSRGYGRSTTGCRTLTINSSAQLYGDEAAQIKRKYPDTVVIVSEKRVVGIDRVRKEHPEVNLVILDDAFQHRAVKPYISLLLSTYAQDFLSDRPFPSGRLREFRRGYRRADEIILTKCPKEAERNDIDFVRRIKDRPVSLSWITYGQIAEVEVYGFSGLANNQVFKSHLKACYRLTGFSNFPDHHVYTEKELDLLKYRAGEATLVCTEKDLVKISDMDPNFPAKAIPVEFKVEEALIERIKLKLKSFES